MSVVTWSNRTGMINNSPIKFGGDLDHPPLDFLQRTTRYISTSTRVAIIVLTALAQILTLYVLFSILSMRKNIVIKLSSTKFCVVILLSALSLLSVLYLLTLNEYTDVQCRAIQIVGHCSFCALFSAMLAKNWRINRLITASKTLRSVSIKDLELFKVVFGVLSIVITLLVLWIIQDGPKSVYVYNENDQEKVSLTCIANYYPYFIHHRYRMC